MLELSINSFEQKKLAESLSYDLSTLGLFKAFSESAPQVTLLLTNTILIQDLQLFTGLNKYLEKKLFSLFCC